MREKLPKKWQAKVEQLDMNEFTAIQTRSFDTLLKNFNLLMVSPTGTGKTLAYLLPLLLKVQKAQGNQLLILAPTAELAVQIHEVVKEWSADLDLKSNVIIGGASLKRQMERLKKAPEVIVGTPGRLLELIKAKKIKLAKIETIVLDEVDQLFEPEQFKLVNRLIRYAPKKYQLVAVSATAERIEAQFSELTEGHFERLIVDAQPSVVDYLKISVEKRKKVELLGKIANVPEMQALVFFNQLNDLGAVEEKLIYQGVPVASLASDVNKNYRKVILDKFKNGELTYLLVTDILARGIDINQLPFVINFDLPMNQESFIHRSGRVGRMGNHGTVLTLVQQADEKWLKKFKVDFTEVTLKGLQFIEKS
ncbi:MULTISPECIES: DEAD/DEAH box helicase [unclassified Enterococcus]|uniref:DEAD/DEAH box helicase n=1 Tax=unclassified Enterococcus TaxID=2608891 RepID=UPI0032DEF50F